MNLDHPALAPLAEALIARYDLKAFIETGTGYGVSLAWATEHGLRCWSCDVEYHQVEAAEKRFKEAKVYYLDSETFLRLACDVEKDRALFWLDAHDAAPEHGIGPLWPLADELSIIKELRPLGRDVILLDDIHDRRFDRERYAMLLADTHKATVDEELGTLLFEPKKAPLAPSERRILEELQSRA